VFVEFVELPVMQDLVQVHFAMILLLQLLIVKVGLLELIFDQFLLLYYYLMAVLSRMVVAFQFVVDGIVVVLVVVVVRSLLRKLTREQRRDLMILYPFPLFQWTSLAEQATCCLNHSFSYYEYSREHKFLNML
jgi:hypothetical protein